MIDSDSFKLHISQADLVAWFNSSPVQYTEIDARPVGVVPPTYTPIGQWVTVGFLHDGFIERAIGPRTRLIAVTHVPKAGSFI